MSGLDKNRFRNKTVAFRMSPEEIRSLDAKVRISGKTKGNYIISSILESKIDIVVGKFESDRLAVELIRLREQIDNLVEKEELVEFEDALKECRSLFLELLNVMTGSAIDGQK